jgi:hypothetical protein
MNTAVYVVVEWEEQKDLINLWIGYSWLCSGTVWRGTGDGLICYLDIDDCDVVELELGQVSVSLWIG